MLDKQDAKYSEVLKNMPRRFELGLLSFGQGYEIELWSYFKAQPPYLPPSLLLLLLLLLLLDMMNDIGIDKKQQRYIIKKMINIAIRATYYIFCCRNRNWDSPDLMQF